jgi:hypothetical protein
MRFIAFVIIALSLWSSRADAQFFRNQGVQLPNVGWLGLASWDRVINNGAAAGANDPGWNIWDQPTLGAGYFRAIGYQLWFEGQAAVGASTTVISNAENNGQPVITLQISTGVRYVFLEERIRPYLGAHIEYLQLIALAGTDAAGNAVTAEIPGNGFLGNTPFFVGLRPCGGVEWVFGDEMALQFELGLVGFLVPDQDRGLGALFLPASVGRLAYNIYF